MLLADARLGAACISVASAGSVQCVCMAWTLACRKKSRHALNAHQSRLSGDGHKQIGVIHQMIFSFWGPSGHRRMATLGCSVNFSCESRHTSDENWTQRRSRDRFIHLSLLCTEAACNTTCHLLGQGLVSMQRGDGHNIPFNGGAGPCTANRDFGTCASAAW